MNPLQWAENNEGHVYMWIIWFVCLWTVPWVTIALAMPLLTFYYLSHAYPIESSNDRT